MVIVKNTRNEPSNSPGDACRRDFDSLVGALSAPDTARRRRAAFVLAPFSKAVSPLLDRLRLEEDASVREAILMSLTRIGSPEAVAGMVECLRSGDAQRRGEAIEAMKLLPEAVAPIMSWLLRDSEPDVRIFAVNVLESLRHRDVEKWLISVIENDDNINVCAAAADLLGEAGTDAAVEPLQRMRMRFPEDPYIAFAVDLVLKRIQGSHA